MHTNEQKIIVVTGATSGIGLAAAEILAGRGISVIGVGRSAERCRRAESLLARKDGSAAVRYVVADLALQGGVRRAAGEIRALLEADGRRGLDGLLNNAGCFSFWMEYTAEGFEKQWALNHLAPFLLTRELMPALEAAPAARVVTVSSGSHYGARVRWDDPQMRRRYNGLAAYGQSKLANVLFTAELNRRLRPGSNVQAFAADPGLVKTQIGAKGTPGFVGWIWRIRQSGGIPPEESAAGIVRLLADEDVSAAAGNYWKHGAPVAPDPRALDAADAERLWRMSEGMCGTSPQPEPRALP